MGRTGRRISVPAVARDFTLAGPMARQYLARLRVHGFIISFRAFSVDMLQRFDSAALRSQGHDDKLFPLVAGDFAHARAVTSAPSQGAPIPHVPGGSGARRHEKR